MTTPTTTLPRPAEAEFQTGQVLTISGGHFLHDTYSAFLAPLLPLIIEKLSLTLTMAGSLSAFMQFPSLLNPFIGYLADKASLRFFIILAPGITATMMSLVGIAPTYAALVVMLLITGLSIAAFHAPAPAMIARVAGLQTGKGMSYFMAAGEMGRTVGPLIAVWGVSAWGLEGIYRLAVIGWGTSVVLYLRFRDIPAHPEKRTGFREMLPKAWRLFLPLFVIVGARSFTQVSLGTFLPTFMSMEGASLWLAGGSLAIFEFAGIGGALAGGTLSDRLGRKPVLLAALAASSALMLVFINVQGWVMFPVLILLGFAALSTQPVLLATVQDELPNHRAIANGTYLGMNFIIRTVTTVAIGLLGDALGLRAAFFWSAIIGLAAFAGVLALPEAPREG